MTFLKADSIKELSIGTYNIPEPQGKEISPKDLDIIYIPALMANKNRYRLGYGKGFYDRFFSQNNLKAKKIIVLPSVFVTFDYIEDEFDFPGDEILTEIY